MGPHETNSTKLKAWVDPGPLQGPAPLGNPLARSHPGLAHQVNGGRELDLEPHHRGGRSGGGLFSQWDGSSSILTLSLRMGLSRERFRAKEPKRVVPVPIPMPSDLWGRKICSRVASIFARFAEGNTCKCAENGRNVAILGQASLGQPPPRSSFVSHPPTRGKKWRGSLLSVRWFQLDTHPELTHGAQQGEI